MILSDRDLHPSVLTLTLNRPEKRNALNAELALELTQTLGEAAQDPSVRAVVLTGAGTAFSAGADLASLQALMDADFETNLKDSRTLAALFETIYQLDKPVVAQVNGHAIAGGCGLAAVCDFVIAAREARLGFTEVRIGFLPAIISVYLLERYPESVVRGGFLLGNLMSAEEALTVGLVHRVPPRSDLGAETAALVRELVRETSSNALAGTKKLLRARHAGTHQAALDAAIQLNARARGTAECRAGVAAFLERRPFPWQNDWDGGA